MGAGGEDYCKYVHTSSGPSTLMLPLAMVHVRLLTETGKKAFLYYPKICFSGSQKRKLITL